MMGIRMVVEYFECNRATILTCCWVFFGYWVDHGGEQMAQYLNTLGQQRWVLLCLLMLGVQ